MLPLSGDHTHNQGKLANHIKRLHFEEKKVFFNWSSYSKMPCIIMTVASCSYVCMCVWCQIAVPVGRLSKEDLQPRLSVHQGIPATASILAFEPVQRVLAVASLYVILTTFVYPFANKSALYDDEQFCII